jgi:hypothetical protein
MPELNWLAIVAAAVIAFVLSTIYYLVLARERAALLGVSVDGEGRPPPWKMAVEILRTAVLAAVVAGLVRLLDITQLDRALQLGVLLWFAFPVVLLSGSVIWDHVPPRLAAIHAGDWLMKLLVIAVVVTLWR